MKKYMFLTMAVLALASCSSSDDRAVVEQQDGLTELRLATVLETEAQTETRAAVDLQRTTVAAEQPVGVYVTTVGTNAYASTYNTLMADLAFTAGSNGSLTPDKVGGVTPAYYFPADGEKINVYVWTPKKQGANGVLFGLNKTFDFSVLTDQSDAANYKNSDLMTGSLTNVARSADAVIIPMQHRLARITVNLKQGNGMDLSKLTEVNILPTIAAGKVTTVGGVYSKVETSGSTATIIKAGDASALASAKITAACSAVIIPQTVIATGFIQVKTSDGGVWVYSLPEATNFDTGKEYIYTITLSSYGLTVSSSVTDWTSINQTTTIPSVGHN